MVTFELDPVGVELLKWCDGQRSLASMAQGISALLRRPLGEVLEDLTGGVALLAEAGLLGLRRSA